MGEEKSREEKSSTHNTHTNAHFALCCSFETRPLRRKGLSILCFEAVVVVVVPKKTTCVFFRAEKFCGSHNKRERERERKRRMGFWGTTFAFVVLEGACAAYINATGIRGANHLKHVLSITAVTCMWMMWAIIYMAQMHPLVQPVMNKSEE